MYLQNQYQFGECGCIMNITALCNNIISAATESLDFDTSIRTFMKGIPHEMAKITAETDAIHIAAGLTSSASLDNICYS